MGKYMYKSCWHHLGTSVHNMITEIYILIHTCIQNSTYTPLVKKESAWIILVHLIIIQIYWTIQTYIIYHKNLVSQFPSHYIESKFVSKYQKQISVSPFKVLDLLTCNWSSISYGKHFCLYMYSFPHCIRFSISFSLYYKYKFIYFSYLWSAMSVCFATVHGWFFFSFWIQLLLSMRLLLVITRIYLKCFMFNFDRDISSSCRSKLWWHSQAVQH